MSLSRPFVASSTSWTWSYGRSVTAPVFLSLTLTVMTFPVSASITGLSSPYSWAASPRWRPSSAPPKRTFVLPATSPARPSSLWLRSPGAGTAGVKSPTVTEGNTGLDVAPAKPVGGATGPSPPMLYVIVPAGPPTPRPGSGMGVLTVLPRPAWGSTGRLSGSPSPRRRSSGSGSVPGAGATCGGGTKPGRPVAPCQPGGSPLIAAAPCPDWPAASRSAAAPPGSAGSPPTPACAGPYSPP